MKQQQQRRLSRAKTTLLVVEPQEAAVANSSKAPNSNNSNTKTRKSDAPALETTFYGGGIPGTALDSERVELPEFTGVREGGYQVGTACFSLSAS